MKTTIIVGIILIILGAAGFIYKGVTYTKKENVVNLGPIDVEKENKKTIPIPDILSGIACGVGIGLVIVGAKKK